MNNIFLYGASGHCKVVIDIINRTDGEIHSIFDDDNSIQQLMHFMVKPFKALPRIKGSFIITIGDNFIRQQIAEKLKLTKFTKAIHPNAIIDSTVTINTGTVVMAGSIINSSVTIGEHCIVNTSASIDHDCKIDNFVHISPNATLCGNVTIGKCTHVGAGSTIIQGVKVGENVTIGAGTVIIKNIPNNATVVGNPGKIIKIKT